MITTNNKFKLMGVINVTPDSFSDGGQFISTKSAFNQAMKLIEQGADIIDIGGESTRPGANIVSVAEEIKRVVPVVQALRYHKPDIIISIDSSKAEVMLAAIKAGANFINDVNALQGEGCLELAAKSEFPICLMHKKGRPKTMQKQPKYDSVVNEVMGFLSQRIESCLQAGIKQDKIILDPGIGFGKTLEHNLALLRNIKQLKSLGFPVLIGVSRKSMIGEILNAEIDDRLYGSLAIAHYAYTHGAEYFRVHDVKATHDVLKIAELLNS